MLREIGVSPNLLTILDRIVNINGEAYMIIE